VLQQRLTASQERDLVIAAESGDSDACRKLVEAFLPAIGDIARGFKNSRVERWSSSRRASPACSSLRGATTPRWYTLLGLRLVLVRKAMQELVAELTRPMALSDRAVGSSRRSAEPQRTPSDARRRIHATSSACEPA